MDTRKMICAGLLMVTTIGLLVGCSQKAPTDPDVANELTLNALDEAYPPTNQALYSYPPEACIPPPGYQFLRRTPDMKRATDDLYATTMINKSQGGTLWLEQNFISILPWSIPHSQWISISMPDPNSFYIDFGPHGLNFSSPQLARLSYAGWTIPPNIDPGSLTIWYWNSELGIYERIGGFNNVQFQYINFQVDHFSRYVVARPNS